MITLRDVTKRYADEVAVDHLSLDVPEGEVCVLIGPSGCGKTTTLRMINRLIDPTSGVIEVQGRDVMSVRPEELRRHIGYVIQSVGLFPHLTVADNIATVPRLLGWKEGRIVPRISELLDLVGLDAETYAGKYPRQLSGGEAQRIGVARALAADPPLLLMDEPFGAVDPLTRDRLQGEFARIQRELRKTVIFVTHDVDEAIRLADRIALMRAGHLEQYDTPETLLDHPVNKFVHDFMGADRALKRLGRVRTADVMRRDYAIARMLEPGEIDRDACEAERFVYLVDTRGMLRGWLDCADLDAGLTGEEAVTEIDWREASVAPDVSLKDALSAMIGLGVRTIPVTEQGILVGTVALSDIEGEMTEADSHISGPAAEDDSVHPATGTGLSGQEG